jgi:hypothetical protein
MKDFRGLSVSLALVISVGFVACNMGNNLIGNGTIISQERMVEGFNGIVLNGVGDININFAENYRVIVTTDSNIQDIVTIKVDGTYLNVDEIHSYNSLRPTKLVIDVYLPVIKRLNLKGVGDIGIGNGIGEDLEISLHGVGDINASKYQIKKGTIDLSGVGNIKIWATEELNGNLTGVGDILYKGNPVRNVRSAGVGKIKSM